MSATALAVPGAPVARHRGRTSRDRDPAGQGRRSPVRGNRLVERDRYCIDVLDQLSAVTAAIDAIGSSDTDEKIDGLVAAVRRYIRRQRDEKS